MASRCWLQQPCETVLAGSFALMALILTNCCLEAQRATSLIQYFQIYHSESKAAHSMSLDNASRIVLLGGHKYDICCHIQPRDSQSQMQFDASIFEERISNYRHRQSVSSCIDSRLSGLQLTTLRRRLQQSSNRSLSGIVQCRGLSSDGMTSMAGWFNYEISVSAELACNFAKLLTAKELALDQQLVFRCQLRHGWPSSVLDCRIDGDNSSSGNSSDVRIRVDEESAEHSSISVELVSWWQHYGSRLVCRTRQACPVDKVCLGDLTAYGATADANLMFRVRSSSSCVFTERPELGQTLARCNSSQGWPSVQHSCKLVSDAGETSLVGNRVSSNSSTAVVSLFSTPTISSAKVVAANTTIECIAQQPGFPTLSFSYVFVYEEKVTLFTASLDWTPIIVSLVILLIIILVILVMVATAIRRRRQPAGVAAGGGKGGAADQNRSGKATE